LASRLAGSSDLYEHSGRRPYASINFVTAHDGFTLADLVSYERKHNEANLDDNRDGTDANDSWNCGVEGPSDDPEIRALRERQRRNLFATLVLSVGVPMLLAGDELGRSQSGNNNGYCQDNEVSWLTWPNGDDGAREFLAFARRVLEIRREQPVLKRRRFFHGRPIRGHDIKDIYWIRPDGREMTDADWSSPALVLGVGLVGNQIDEVDERGQRIVGDTLVLLLNGSNEPVTFHSSPDRGALVWECLLDTARPERDGVELGGIGSYELAPHSLALMRIEIGRVRPVT
jgi:glycogen operon protein